MKATVSIMPRSDVPDSVGETIREQLYDVGSSDIRRVSVGKQIILDFEGGDISTVTERVKKLCQEFLVNDLLEEFTFKVEE